MKQWFPSGKSKKQIHIKHFNAHGGVGNGSGNEDQREQIRQESPW